MSRTGFAAVGIASTVILGGGLFFAAQASDPPQSSCREAIRLAESMADTNGQLMATNAARSIAYRLDMPAKGDRLLVKVQALQAEHSSAHVAFREAAATCR